jgi:hypothetical protein
MDMGDLIAVMTTSFADAGWSEPEKMAAGMAEDIAEEADSWPEGTRLRRAIDEVTAE